jgi:ribulose-5-phosphate 4-epimerase/fuculose-1-phosphate aldolase
MVQLTEFKEQMLEGCRRLASKGFLNTPADSFSMRIPGQKEMLLISGIENWLQIGIADLGVVPFSTEDAAGSLHGCVYQERGDVGAIAISSPKGVRLLAHSGGVLPLIFDEQVRHIGAAGTSLKDEAVVPKGRVRKAFSRGANATLLGERLLCLGMTRDRVLFNSELYEKCAQAYVIAKASGRRIGCIPFWVRLIASRRLLKDEGVASASYRDGRTPEGIKAY